MHIIILGAGRIGQHVAQNLSQDGHSVILVDASRERLEEASTKTNVDVRLGVGTEWELLQELMQPQNDTRRPELFCALTDNDEVNLVACSIAKSLGNPRTIARIRESRYASHSQFDVNRLFHVDHIVIPDLLVADSVIKIAMNAGLYSQNFFHGGVILRTITIPANWSEQGRTLAELKISERRLMVAIIRRRGVTIFPHGKERLLAGDEITFIGDTSLDTELNHLLALKEEVPKTAFVVGGGNSFVGSAIASTFRERRITTQLVEPTAARAWRLAGELPGVTILHHPNCDFELLQQERVGECDLFVAATTSDEKNLQLSLFAKELGVRKIISMFGDPATARLAEKQSISQVVSMRIATTDTILALARRKKVHSILSLYDNTAEVIEVRVSAHSPLIGIPLSLLGPRLPDELLIAAIHNRGRIFIAGGSHILAPQDDVIVVCHPKQRKYLEEIF